MAGTSPKKRIRRSAADARSLILDTAGRIMIEEGYAAVTARRIAKEIGMTSAVIHYHYPTVDDLFVALHADLMERHVAILRRATETPEPLKELWRVQTDLQLAGLGIEFLALTNHRKSIAPQIAECARRSRDEQMTLLGSSISIRKQIPGMETPVGIIQILLGLSRMVTNEETIGLDYGHADVSRFVEWLINEISASNPTALAELGRDHLEQGP